MLIKEKQSDMFNKKKKGHDALAYIVTLQKAYSN